MTAHLNDLTGFLLQAPSYHLIFEAVLIVAIIRLFFMKSYKPERTVLTEKVKWLFRLSAVLQLLPLGCVVYGHYFRNNVTVLKLSSYWHCLHSMQSRVYEMVQCSVRPILHISEYSLVALYYRRIWYISLCVSADTDMPAVITFNSNWTRRLKHMVHVDRMRLQMRPAFLFTFCRVTRVTAARRSRHQRHPTAQHAAWCFSYR